MSYDAISPSVKRGEKSFGYRATSIFRVHANCLFPGTDDTPGECLSGCGWSIMYEFCG